MACLNNGDKTPIYDNKGGIVGYVIPEGNGYFTINMRFINYCKYTQKQVNDFLEETGFRI